jgi:hypothetical protein
VGRHRIELKVWHLVSAAEKRRILDAWAWVEHELVEARSRRGVAGGSCVGVRVAA